MRTFIHVFRSFVVDIHSKTGQLLNRGSGSAQQVSGPGVGSVDSKSIQEMKESLNLVRRDLGAVNQRLAASGGAGGAQAQTGGGSVVQCPDIPPVSCVSTTIFIALMVAQLVILISYLMYR